MSLPRSIFIWGASGQAKVVRAICRAANRSVEVTYDQNPHCLRPYPEGLFIHDKDELQRWLDQTRQNPCGFVVAIGGAKGHERAKLSAYCLEHQLKAFPIQHATAWVASTAIVGQGCQILAMAAISEDVILGDWVIINTQASVDHECQLGHGVHVMPGAILAGNVSVGDYATIGSGAVILPRIKIGAHAIIGAGAVVTSDVPANSTVVGNPAKPLEKDR